mgnify:CR=1 FL=1
MKELESLIYTLEKSGFKEESHRIAGIIKLADDVSLTGSNIEESMASYTSGNLAEGELKRVLNLVSDATVWLRGTSAAKIKDNVANGKKWHDYMGGQTRGH